MSNPAKHKMRNSQQKGQHLLGHRLQLVQFVATRTEFFAYDYLCKALYPEDPHAFFEQLSHAFHSNYFHPELGYKIQMEVIPRFIQQATLATSEVKKFLPQGEEKIRETLSGDTRHLDDLPAMLIHSLQVLSYFV